MDSEKTAAEKREKARLDAEARELRERAVAATTERPLPVPQVRPTPAETEAERVSVETAAAELAGRRAAAKAAERNPRTDLPTRGDRVVVTVNDQEHEADVVGSEMGLLVRLRDGKGKDGTGTGDGTEVFVRKIGWVRKT